MESIPDINTRVLRYFVTLAQAGTYTRAAEVLHVATPSLSQQISKLEHDLGVRLIERDHRGARLTEAGAEFLPLALDLLSVHDQAVGVVRRHRRAAQQRIRIGFFATVAGPRTHEILDKLRKTLPGINIELVQVGWGEQITAVLDGRVDVVFARPPLDTQHVRVFPVFTEKRVLVMSANHRLAAKPELTTSDLADVVQVDTDNVPEDWRRWWSVDPRPDGSPVTYGPLVHGVEEMLEVVATSDTVAITAESLITAFPRQDIVYRPIIDIDPTQIVLVTPTEERLTIRALIHATR
ncbi:LysR family transcriptional regulator [Rhodococcus sp. ABRD24]|uniref:LysR family transcriptional regulator n=1 Tax=Rhodococcus sp. ABRD24 TaxID=2507582 RepID=UPI00103AE21C|nr:LysR substrate-binding domain-containing protein [Rhodococcus sp. ABRD24]QBJ96594.1 LysR family transcriptional regulator [Rhodococcus sp. ABRD24]